MQQGIIFGNAFQRYMGAKFGVDMYSTSAIMANVRGKENLVLEKLEDIFEDAITTQEKNVRLWQCFLKMVKH